MGKRMMRKGVALDSKVWPGLSEEMTQGQGVNQANIGEMSFQAVSTSCGGLEVGTR